MMPYADPHSAIAIASRDRRARRTYYKHREKNIARVSKYNREHKEQVNQAAVRRRSQRMAPERVLWWNARNRSKAHGIEFSLEIADITIPALCPVLHIPLVIATGYAKAGSPSLDRIDPSKGYVRGNVRVISHKANTIKSNASIADIEAVLAYMRSCRCHEE